MLCGIFHNPRISGGLHTSLKVPLLGVFSPRRLWVVMSAQRSHVNFHCVNFWLVYITRLGPSPIA